MTATTTKRRTSKVDMVKLMGEALNAPGHLSSVYTLFYDYSFGNQIWLWSQGVSEPCGPYRFWLNKLGRQVRKGEKANTVLHPVFVTKRDKETGAPVLDAQGRKQMILVKFSPKATVFGYSQTDGPEIEFPVLPDWDLKMALKALDIKKVAFKSTDGNTQGYSVERTYAINPVVGQPMKTTFHELAHIVLGHTTKDALKEYHDHRGIKEFQAESVAYLLSNELQLEDWDASASRGYIQHWLAGINEEVDVTDAHIRQVFAAVNKILVAGRPPRTNEEE